MLCEVKLASALLTLSRFMLKSVTLLFHNLPDIFLGILAFLCGTLCCSDFFFYCLSFVTAFLSSVGQVSLAS